MTDSSDIDALASETGYRFRDNALAELAMTHTSFAHENDRGRGNERLEFLGDAVLDLVVSDILFEVHPDWDEGDLTRTRAGLVNQASLAGRAREVGLNHWVRLGRTEQTSGGADKDRILANCFEALVGAIYRDGGLEPTTQFVRSVFGDSLEQAQREPRDAKTQFQEWAHARFATTPRYETVGDTGADDDDVRFTVEVSIDGQSWGRGVGRSKRRAEREAASNALERGKSLDE